MNDLMLQVLVIAIVANVVLVIVAIVRSRMLRPGRDLAAASATMVSPEGLGAPSMAAMAGSPLEPSPGTTPPEPPSPEPPAFDALFTGDETEMSANPDEPMRPRRFAMPDDADYPPEASVHAFLDSGPRASASVTELYDADTGLRSGLAWDEAIGHEEARRARYGRPVTVVVVELDRLDALARQLGRENADRLIRPVAQALLVNARASDLVARLGHHRFGVLLPETDEIRAINYVERVRLACDAWLEAAAVSVRLSIGWANAPTGGDLPAAFAIAERRMYADRSSSRSTPPSSADAARPAPSTPPATAPAQAAAEPEEPDDDAAPYVAWGDAAPDLGAG